MKYILEPSRTFNEFLILPNLTKREHNAANVSLKTPLVKFKKGQKSAIELDIPIVAAMMQAVSSPRLAAELARFGGIAFIHSNQTIKDQVRMIKETKEQKVLAGAGVNTHDYKDRIPALVDAGADCLCIDSSDGFSEWQGDTIKFVREKYGDKVKIGAGNIVAEDAFNYLADAGADFIKVGVGGGSICITREQKGIGRGQASALIEVVAARDKYFEKTGAYIPVCSDGSIVFDTNIIVALAMGADFVMMGRYFARLDESPSPLVEIDGKKYKEYWGEGSARAQNWQRYGASNMKFVEGVDSYVPYEGKMSDKLERTLAKIKSTMCNCGSLDLKTFYKTTRLTVISPASITEGGAHNVKIK